MLIRCNDSPEPEPHTRLAVVDSAGNYILVTTDSRPMAWDCGTPRAGGMDTAIVYGLEPGGCLCHADPVRFFGGLVASLEPSTLPFFLPAWLQSMSDRHYKPLSQ